MPNNINWVRLFPEDIQLTPQYNLYPTKGKLVYEYNPFRNYRLSENKYEYEELFYTLKELEDKHGIVLDKDSNWQGIPNGHSEPVLFEKGLLVDFVTDELKFSLEHPVHIVPLYSYDGSVNLIINDGLNIPRLINSRFSATGRNTYEIVDRKGNNDTNIYDLGDQFDVDTSLYKRIVKIPKITYDGCTPGGNLKVGNYHFYFKLADADGNETDFVGESSLVSVFIGFKDPLAICTGTKNENSYKNVNFSITNIDTAYDNVTVYYSRSTAEGAENSITEYAKVDKKFIVNSAGCASIMVTGFEDIINLTASDINLNYNVVDSVVTSAQCLNMLFLGNVHKPNIPYEELADLSLRFLPYLKLTEYKLEINEQYHATTYDMGYYDDKYIYDKVGYWGEELYRFGIVYIMPNNELTPVFNIRGGTYVGEYNEDIKWYSNIPITDKDDLDIRKKILYNEENFYILGVEKENRGLVLNENVKGVVKFLPTKDTNTVYGVDIRANDETIQELKKYVKGYFFVRQTRIPTVLALGITIGIELISKTPCIPTADGFLNLLADSLEKSHVQTADINDVNYISEGFLNRYSFKFKKKSSSLFGKILKVAAIAVGVVAVAAACVFAAPVVGSLIAGSSVKLAVAAGVAKLTTVATAVVGVLNVGAAAAAAAAEAAALVAGATTASIAAASSAAVLAAAGGVWGAVGIIAGAAAVTAGVVTAAAGGVLEIRYALSKAFEKRELNGRQTKVPSGYKLVETEESRRVSTDFFDRFIPKDPSKVKVQAILCPDYSINQAYYNQIFTGNTHAIQLTNTQCVNGLVGHSRNYFTNNYNHFYIPEYYDMNIRNLYNFKIIGVADGVKMTGLDELKFRSKAGEAEEAWRFEYIGEDYSTEKSIEETADDTSVQIKKSIVTVTVEDGDEYIKKYKKINTDIIRGKFGPYLAFNDTQDKFSPAETVNIYIPEYSIGNMSNYVLIRTRDTSPFYAISDRYDISEINDQRVVKASSLNLDNSGITEGYRWELYRGDCYICQFTHRLNRNFNDPSAPYNDEIVDDKTWKDNYDPDNVENYEKINLGDINAVGLGMWVTFRVRSSNNLNIRTLDGSNVDETAMTGHPHGFYPYHPMSTEGTYKHADSYIYNKGFTKSVSERWNFELPDVPYIKNWFGTRIMYSDIHVNDAYKNGYRVFQGTHYRDYTREYGEIVKLISLESDLLCIFEHGIARIPVNERAVASQGSGGFVYINTSNVLPENPEIISDMYGSQWAESVLKVPGLSGDSPLYVYGVDTVAKKIWRTDGRRLECISDFKVQEFLNNNITLGERELTPKIGIRNVKTTYNAFKRDVMFTFYDNTYGFEEKVWNLCWNELLLKFITFYSWVPSYMENINNVPFSFDRNTSKWIAKLGVSHTKNSFADGITLSSVIIDDNNWSAELSLSNRILPNINKEIGNVVITYTLERDNYGNHEFFYIENGNTLRLKPGVNVNDLESELYYRNIEGHVYADDEINMRKPGESGYDRNLPIFKNLAGLRPTLKREEMVNPDKIVRLLNIKANINIEFNSNVDVDDAYYNMKAGYNSSTTLVSAGYYESAVAIIPKNNILFLSTDFWKHGLAGIIDIADTIKPTYWYGKQHPFEFECVVVNDPSIHKIFTNLELVANKAKPESFHYEVIGDVYDFANDKPNMYIRQEALKELWQYNGIDITYNRNYNEILPNLQYKSADLVRKYHARLDTINEIEDYYVSMTTPKTHDYRHLSGGEIVYYPTRSEFRIWNHVKATTLNDLLDTTDRWNKESIYNKYGKADKISETNSYSGGRSIIGANCEYLEDKWRISINPLLVYYKNEYLKPGENVIHNGVTKTYNNDYVRMCNTNSSWFNNVPPITIYNSPLPEEVINKRLLNIEIPKTLEKYKIDTSKWGESSSYGAEGNRLETDIRGKFMKVRIRYSGEELAIVDFLNTIYRISYA